MLPGFQSWICHILVFPLPYLYLMLLIRIKKSLVIELGIVPGTCKYPIYIINFHITIIIFIIIITIIIPPCLPLKCRPLILTSSVHVQELHLEQHFQFLPALLHSSPGVGKGVAYLMVDLGERDTPLI